ncbi:MAG TPA: DNA polymerase III subunit gamma/tau [Ilumatobacteraceae bacterium]
MATQSLYRRYRPRRFSEIRGQDHVVRGLRNAVIHGREGQGYLFSGPRGTGKTTSARILAKVLNCTNPVDGEPCCECASCLAVESGTSYDVHELDAASNNGVEAMRDLIEKASLGTPGRHKVYILDEVHMLSKGAEAALLKTLEEPPPHVVFVLATTDPQKVSPTIRSRVQHLEFHLLPMDELEAHIRWVANDAGLVVSEDAIQAVLAQGGGSARDTLSALELVAASGGEAPDAVSYDEFIEALIARDPGRALAALAYAVQQGRDPRVLAQELIRYLRDCFLSLMAPELVQLPDHAAAVVSDQAQRLGAALIVRSMERLGEMLVEMRHTPDPRLLLDVALVQLTHDSSGADVGALLARIERLERGAGGGAGGASSSSPSTAAARAVPRDPETGRAAIGGRLRRDPPPVATAPAEPAPPPAPAPAPTPQPAPQPAAVAAVEATAGIADRVAESWSAAILPTLKPMARALFSAGHFVGERDGALLFGLPNDTHRVRSEEYRADVEAAVSAFAGTRVALELVVAASAADDTLASVTPLRPASTNRNSTRPGSVSPRSDSASTAGAPAAAHDDRDEDIDLHDLVDVPPESVKSPLDRLTEAFPGSVVVEDPR